MSEDGCMLVPLLNVQGTSARLDKGMEVGVAHCMEGTSSLRAISERVPPDTPTGRCAEVTTVLKTPERLEHLKQALGMPHAELSSSQGEELTKLICDFSDVFALCDSELGCTNLVQHSIDTGDNHPQPYRTPIVHRETIGRMIDEMQEQGVIQPSASPWASPVVLVPKKDGSK